MKKLLFLALLTACGTSEMSDSQKEQALAQTETTDSVPDLSKWQIMPNATDSCISATAESIDCKSQFEGGERNCGDATFKFIVKDGGYMYVYTLEHVIIRQGEPHTLKFEGKPETYNIQSTASEQYHAFQCYGASGEIVKL